MIYDVSWQLSVCTKRLVFDYRSSIYHKFLVNYIIIYIPGFIPVKKGLLWELIRLSLATPNTLNMTTTSYLIGEVVLIFGISESY